MKFTSLLTIAIIASLFGAIFSVKLKDYPSKSGNVSMGDNKITVLANSGLAMSCPAGSVLAGFHLIRTNSLKDLQYEYKCMKHAGVGNITKEITNAATAHSGDVGYLDRQYVKCPANHGVQKIELKTAGSGLINYVYTCVNVNSNNCKNELTSEQELTTEVIYLDRQHVTPKDGKFLQQFRFVSLGGKKGLYELTYCDALSPPAPSPPQNPTKNADNY